MQIIKVKLDEIKPYDNNVKEHPAEQIEQIKQSITDFGNNDPIAIDEDNVIIEGHGRYMALKALGYEDAECIRLTGLTDDQKNAYRLVHNKLTMNSGFDLEALTDELKKINIDMRAFDFDIDELLKDVEAKLDPDAADELDEIDAEPEPRVKRGQVWRLGNHYLMCGDATSLADIEKLINRG